ncbi:2'-5' RNA ligase family protein [Streptosporangium nondiastaticum]|uniref:2'-5' RNA ligase family protein n=1 Tax=Streptosporangium nondiastaticum TaxID=35764 RepID=UPI001CB98CD3
MRTSARPLTAVIGRHHAFDLLFESCERFPGVLYLAPVPDAQVRQLTEEITARWPEAPPYGGKFSEVVPHLTIADGPDDAVLDETETSILPHLPIASRVSSVDLMVHDGARWQTRVSFPLLE